MEALRIARSAGVQTAPAVAGLEDDMRVGFVGAGLMGAPMVRRLVEAGHDVVVSSRDPARLADTGWQVVGSPAEAADGALVVCSIVPDGPEVTAVVGSVLKTAAPGTVIVEMSTISPDDGPGAGGTCAGAGVDYLDCPVSGGPPGAEAGTLAIWVGGAAEALERARPVLEVHRPTRTASATAARWGPGWP